MKNTANKNDIKMAALKGGFVALCVLFCFVLMKYAVNGYVLTSIAASAFIAFSFPRARFSGPRHLLGGYACGIAAGAVGWAILQFVPMPTYFDAFWGVAASCAVAVFIVTFLMIMFGMGHPPAAAVAISIVIDPHPAQVAIIAAICIAALTVIKIFFLYILKKYEDRKSECGTDE